MNIKKSEPISKFSIMTPADLRTARRALGMTQHALAEALRMGKHGWQSVSRWEQDSSTIPGPVQVAVECLLSHRGEQAPRRSDLGAIRSR